MHWKMVTVLVCDVVGRTALAQTAAHGQAYERCPRRMNLEVATQGSTMVGKVRAGTAA